MTVLILMPQSNLAFRENVMLTVMMTIMKNNLEEVQYKDVKSWMWVLVFYQQEKWLGNEGQVGVKDLKKPFGVSMLPSWKKKRKGRMKPFITIKSTKQMLCDGNLEVAQVKSFSGRTDLYKVLTIEAFIMMLLSKTCLNHKVTDWYLTPLVF